MQILATEKLLVEALMFPETDEGAVAICVGN
jgi:hypothetical protein